MLIFLEKESAHGYRLGAQFKAEGIDINSSSTYRTLRKMAEYGFVSSYWDGPDVGPASRVYEITKEGKKELKKKIGEMEKDIEIKQHFLNLYHSR